jgi:SMODS and SLOG-associating 2TM effector domain 1/Protein of unknown function (DUF4231)
LLGTLAGLVFKESGLEIARWLAIGAPAALAAAVGYAAHESAGKRWIPLRAAAETSKVEIYRYRTRTGAYGRAAPERTLAEELRRIGESLGDKDASSGRLELDQGRAPPDLNGFADDGLSRLEAPDYVQHRLVDQIDYYRRRVREMVRQRARLVLFAGLSGAAGTVIAAAGAAAWVALSSAVAAGLASYLGILQLDRRIVVYNQSADRLDGLHGAWVAHGEAPSKAAFSRLVADVERALTKELAGWVDQMGSVVDEQQKDLDKQAEA